MTIKRRKVTLEVETRGSGLPDVRILVPAPKPVTVEPYEPSGKVHALPPGVKESLFLGTYKSREELEKDVDFWDATTAGQYAWCPRHAMYSQEIGLVPIEEQLQLDAGNAMHAALHTLYVSGDSDLGLGMLRHVFDPTGKREPPGPNHGYAHLHLGLLEVVYKNYLPWSKTHDAFKPVIIRFDELDLTDVVAAVWQVLDDGRVILGESKIVMRFDVDGEEFIYSGKPDLPIFLGGSYYIMDHKTSCGGYLSDWYFAKHQISNQLRGYCKMIEKLLSKVLAKKGIRGLAGAYINGVYAGDKATTADPKSKLTRFSRFGPLKFFPSHLDEAIVNQWAWRQMREVYRELAKSSPSLRKFGWPQNTGKSCQGCPFLEKLCQVMPKARQGNMLKHFTVEKRRFLDL